MFPIHLWDCPPYFYSIIFIVFCFSYFHHSSASVTLLLVPSIVFLISVIAFFIVACLFFNSSRSSFNISCIFLNCTSSFYLFLHFIFKIFESSLLSLLWILILVDCLFLLHLFGLEGFYHVPSSAGCFSVFSFCVIYCVWGLFSENWKVIVPLNFRVCLFNGLWMFPGWGNFYLYSGGWS